MYRHIYNWIIIACDFMQPISLTLTLIHVDAVSWKNRKAFKRAVTHIHNWKIVNPEVKQQRNEAWRPHAS